MYVYLSPCAVYKYTYIYITFTVFTNEHLDISEESLDELDPRFLKHSAPYIEFGFVQEWVHQYTLEMATWMGTVMINNWI